MNFFVLFHSPSLQEQGTMFAFFFCIFFNLLQIQTALELKRNDFTDYCEWFGEDEIQGKCKE